MPTSPGASTPTRPSASCPEATWGARSAASTPGPAIFASRWSPNSTNAPKGSTASSGSRAATKRRPVRLRPRRFIVTGRGPSPDRVASDGARTIGGHGDYEHTPRASSVVAACFRRISRRLLADGRADPGDQHRLRRDHVDRRFAAVLASIHHRTMFRPVDRVHGQRRLPLEQDTSGLATDPGGRDRDRRRYMLVWLVKGRIIAEPAIRFSSWSRTATNSAGPC